MGTSIKHQDWSNKTVLIAEDVNDNFLFLKTYLRKTKINVLWAKDGQEAINICKKDESIDIVLMDISMPDMDGIRATELLSYRAPTTSVIIMSFQSETEYMKKAMMAGAKEYIVKPFTGNDIINTIL